MASSSNIPEEKYDVFLSFRGEDTRNNFTSHLEAALCRKKIRVFIDYELNRGEEISPSLLKAIEQSKISVIILSEKYASSRWCLEELAKILDCKQMFGQIVIPIFYHVDPSHVRNQTGAFGNAFAALEKRFEERLERWKTALREVANLSGWTIDSKKSESKLIDETMEDILRRLNKMSLSDHSDLIGVESAIKEIESLLKIGSHNVCIVGIWGLGGIGKTSISHAIFNKHLSYFEGSFFAKNVREESNKSKALTSLRQELFSTILEDRNANIGLNFTKIRLACMKVFIVFDDVTSLNQIKILIGDPKCLGLGSRIIITSRDKQVLKNCRADQIYKLKELSRDKALQLFNRHAFKHNRYAIKEYMELSKRMVTYAKGIPLALEILGSSLLEKTKQDWESAVNKLERSPPKDIQNVLKISFDGLDYEQKEIFLDIACFFNWEDKDLVIDVLDSCDFSTNIGLSVLIDKSLIVVSENMITMHNLLEEMGREIVRQESIEDPGKRSRLFHHKDIYHVLTRNKGTEAIKGIRLDMSKVGEMHLTHDAFSKMQNLKYLKVYSPGYEEDFNKLYEFQDSEFEFPELKYLFWQRYPWTSLPPKFHPENLVALKMPGSNIKQLWLGVQNIVNLKHIDLSGSQHLLKCPDLSLAKNLETLNLFCCERLIEIHSSIQYLNKLTTLDLRHCKRLCSIPPEICSKSLREVRFGFCSKLDTVPSISCNVEALRLQETAIRELPSSIETLSKLVALNLHGCTRLESLPSGIGKLKSLENLYLDGCSRLENLPRSISSLNALRDFDLSRCSGLKIVSSFPCNIQSLCLRGSAIQELPSSIQYLSKLVKLDLTDCSSLESLPSSIGKLKSLENLCLFGCLKLNSLPDEIGDLEALTELDATCTSIKEVPPSIGCLNNLTSLNLSDCCITELPNSLGQLTSLEELYINRNKFESIPASIINLSNLWLLELCNCDMLKSLPELPSSIQSIVARNCKSLELLSGLSMLSPARRGRFYERAFCTVDFINCSKLDQSAPEDIVKSALENTERRATIFTEHISYAVSGGCLFYPGSSIPEWFTFRSKGSFIELPPSCLNDDLVGLSFCVVISPQHGHDKSKDWIVVSELQQKSDGEQYEKKHRCCWLVGSTIDSDHVLLRYRLFTLVSYGLRFNCETLFKFDIQDFKDSYLECYEVKECGVLFYPQTSGEPMKESVTSVRSEENKEDQ